MHHKGRRGLKGPCLIVKGGRQKTPMVYSLQEVDMIPVKEFGRTGHLSSRVLFGAAALGEVNQKEADETFALLQKYGINHIDTARSYGEAEVRLGPLMKKDRKEYFLASKTNKRTKVEALEELYQSLERLQTDHIDLWQLHFLVDPQEWEIAMGEGGVLEAALDAKRQGLVKYLGVTGHGIDAPKSHFRSLLRYDFDSVLFPYNYLMMKHTQYHEDVDALVSLCKERNVAIQTIKSLAKRPMGDRKIPFATWYEPLSDKDSIDMSVAYVLQNPDIFLNSTGDIHLLPFVLEAADTLLDYPTDEAMEALVKAYDMEMLFT